MVTVNKNSSDGSEVLFFLICNLYGITIDGHQRFGVNCTMAAGQCVVKFRNEMARDLKETFQVN